MSGIGQGRPEEVMEDIPRFGGSHAGLLALTGDWSGSFLGRHISAATSRVNLRDRSLAVPVFFLDQTEREILPLGGGRRDWNISKTKKIRLVIAVVLIRLLLLVVDECVASC